MTKSELIRAAYTILCASAPSIADPDALHLVDQDVLEHYIDQTWETVTPKGLAVAAARYWIDILAGELEDLENDPS